MSETLNPAPNVRLPAVAGMFYPADASALRLTIQDMLDATVQSSLRDEVKNATFAAELPRPLKAIIVPHAGYVYSGAVAACAYQYLKTQHALTSFRHIVILGPAHRVGFRGIASPGCSAFQTPLGESVIDSGLLQKIQNFSSVVEMPEAHALEHSLEVQVPFLQICCPEASILPLVIGEAAPDEVSQLLEVLMREPQTFLVISSDLSHYLPYIQSQGKDRETTALIEARAPVLRGDQACGCRPLNGFLNFCQKNDWEIQMVDLRNSGDTSGDKSRVVGYGAFVAF